MDAVAKVQLRHQPLNLPLHYQRPLFSRPISSLPFRTTPPLPLPSLSLESSFSVRASSSSPSSSFSSDHSMPYLQIPKSHILETLNPFLFSFLKIAGVAAAVATAVFFARFNLKPAVAAAIWETPSVETSKNNLEEHLQVEIKKKAEEAIVVVEELAALEPNEMEWPLMRAHLHCYHGELERAKLAFDKIIEKDPFLVEAYHGLLMVALQSASPNEMKKIGERVIEATKKCKSKNKSGDTYSGLCRLSLAAKMLIAHTGVIERKYDCALKVYQELVKEERRDFQPYLCQGIIYSLLGKEKEARRQFGKSRRLVPKGHPYAKFLTDDRRIASPDFWEEMIKNPDFWGEGNGFEMIKELAFEEAVNKLEIIAEEEGNGLDDE